MMPKYAICPGYVKSETDVQFHYIDAVALMRLYEVAPTDCVIISSKTSTDVIRARTNNATIFLHPDPKGKYERPS